MTVTARVGLDTGCFGGIDHGDAMRVDILHRIVAAFA